VVKHRAQCLTWPIAEYLARDHEHLAAVEVIEKRRELEPRVGQGTPKNIVMRRARILGVSVCVAEMSAYPDCG
jgi:hypothetical protein